MLTEIFKYMIMQFNLPGWILEEFLSTILFLSSLPPFLGISINIVHKIVIFKNINLHDHAPKITNMFRCPLDILQLYKQSAKCKTILAHYTFSGQTFAHLGKKSMYRVTL